MRTFVRTGAAAALMVATLTTAAGAHASETAQSAPGTSADQSTTTSAAQPLACYEHYHDGCLPWQMRRPGPRGWGCYPC